MMKKVAFKLQEQQNNAVEQQVVLVISMFLWQRSSAPLPYFTSKPQFI